MPIHHQETHTYIHAQSPQTEYDTTPHFTLLNWILAEQPSDMCLLDVGCGSGRLTLNLAPFALAVIGLDRDWEALERARQRAQKIGLTNVRFIATDVEARPYAEILSDTKIDMVVANLCMSNAIMERAHVLLPVGGQLIFTTLHASQWQEAGYRSRFAYSTSDIYQTLNNTGWYCEAIERNSHVLHFQTVANLEQYFAGHSLRNHWQQDGRWAHLVQHIANGGERLTIHSHLVVKARKMHSA
jgi:SAM-dependent methyltransferase